MFLKSEKGRILLILAALLLAGTLYWLFTFWSAHATNSKRALIGLDPILTGSYGHARDVYPFTLDVLAAISKESEHSYIPSVLPWDTLRVALDRNECDALISKELPHAPWIYQYDFSAPFLLTGPILVTSSIFGTPIHDLGDLDHQTLGLMQEMIPKDLTLPEDTDILWFADPKEAFKAVLTGDVAAAAVYVTDVLSLSEHLSFFGLQPTLKPLSQEGLRLICLKGKNEALLKNFDTAVEQIRASGSYGKLIDKWRMIGGL